jgi:hypothetical protein
MNAADFFRLARRHRGRTGGTLFAALLVCLLVGWAAFPNAFFSAYWYGLMFWMQLSIGCLIVLLIQNLTGGAWGRASAPLLRLGVAGLFVLMPLFVPVFFALPHLFSWTAIQRGVSDQVLVNKMAWLNPPGFIVRTILYLAILGVIAWRTQRAGTDGPGLSRAASGLCLVGVVYTLSFASADWMMSLEPSYYSSLYPFMYFSGAMVCTLALLVAALAWGQLRGDTPPQPDVLHDVGKLLFASVLFWGYIEFSQYIIIWTANLPDEAAWYLVRSRHGWGWLTLFVMTFHLAVPFFLLLSQTLKREPRSIFRIGLGLFLVHFAELYWLMAPRRGSHFHLNLFDLLLPLLIGACWVWFIAGRRDPVRPLLVPPEPAS